MSDAKTTVSGRIPCLDGLRATAVILLLLSHGAHGHNQTGFPQLHWLPFTGTTGLCIFFIISGYLITRLLLDEKMRRTQISLRLFYARRFLRIFPAFYFYLGVVALLWALGFVHLNSTAFLASATYWMNIYKGPTDWYVGHSWSLAVEEQFYLLWPLAIAFFTRRASAWIALAVIGAWPLARILRHGLGALSTPGWTAIETANMETIMFGCLLALLTHKQSTPRAFYRANTAFASAVILTALYLSASHWHTSLTFLLPWLRNLCITLILFYCVKNENSLPGHILELRPIVYIGTISYSVYLWQQMFLGDFGRWPMIKQFPVCILGTFACAMASYHFIEMPINLLKNRLKR